MPLEMIKAAIAGAEPGAVPAAKAPHVGALPTEAPVPLDPMAHCPPPDNLAPEVGSTIKHYELLRKLGEGGMGTVFVARDTTLGRLVAIKVLQMQSGPNAERFLIEAQATARCRHDNIVVIHEVGEHHGYPYMVLEYLEGRTLREWMAERDPSSEPVSPSLAIELMLPVVRALSCAHPLGIVHRDLKPENIFLTEAGRVVVLDFGIAKRLEANKISAIHATARRLAKSAGPTQEGALVGTLPYMSPEQLRAEDVDARSDLWTVGILLYELISGAHPLTYRSVFELLDIGNSEEPMPSVHDKRPDVGALGAIIDRCLQKPRAKRYASAEELVAALAALALGGKASELGEDESLFAGLSAFQEADAERYVGREREVVGLVGRLRNQPLVVVAGSSGAGKSSFVRAGVIPALKRSGEHWEAFIVRPGRRPLAALADVVAQLGPATREDAPANALEARATEALLGALPTQPGLVGALLRARCRREGGRHRLLLFVDQFEELYTLGADATERAAFVACLEGVADDASSPLRVMLSLRSDFLYRMADEGHFTAEVTRGLVFLRAMGRDGLRAALTRPLEAAGYRFENEAMVEAMVGGLEQTKSPLPLLQFTAAKLWEARDRTSRLLTQTSYDQLGGVAGALSAHANAVLSALSVADQRLCRAVFLRLCTPERTRAVVSLPDLRGLAAEDGAVEQVIHRLSDARLILVEAGGEREGTTVELCHESLIDSWDKFQQWLSESEQDAQFVARLHVAAQKWETSQEAEGLLWRDRPARDAAEWLTRRRAEQGAGESLGLGKREERFLVAVVALSERGRRRQRIMAGMLATVSVIAVVGAGVVLRSQAADPCAGAGAAIDEAWSTDRQVVLHAAFGRSDLPFAELTWQGLKTRIDGYASHWRDQATAACRATHIAGTQSAQLLDKRMLCLDRGRRELAALVTELGAGGSGAVEHAIEAALALPELDACSRAENLLFGLAAPPAPIAARVAAIRDQLARASALELLGRYEESLAIARDASVLAKGLDYPPVYAEALAQTARALDVRGTADAGSEAKRLYTDALDIAEAERHDQLAVEIWNKLVMLAVQLDSSMEQAHALWRRNAAAVRRVGDDAYEQAKLHHTLGEIYFHESKYALEADEERRAIDAISHAPAHQLELSRYDDGLARALEQLDDLDGAIELHERALAIATKALGAGHPSVIKLKINYGNALEKRRQPGRARLVLEDALNSMTARDRDSHPDAARIYSYLSDVDYLEGHLDDAAEHARASLAIYQRTLSPDHVILAEPYTNLANAEFKRRNFHEALAMYEHALALRRRYLGDDHYHTGLSEGSIAETLAKLERYDDAMPHLVEAERIFQRSSAHVRGIQAWLLTVRGEILAGKRQFGAAIPVLEQALFDDDVVDPGNHGLAMWALARALHGLGRDVDRVRSLAERAGAIFAAQGVVGAYNRDAVARFLGRLPTRQAPQGPRPDSGPTQ